MLNNMGPSSRWMSQHAWRVKYNTLHFTCVLNHSLDAAHSLDSLSSERDERRVYGPAHILDNLSATWERSKISNDMIQFMKIESLAIWIFGRPYGSKMIMENRWRDQKILCSNEDNLVSRPKS